VKWLQSNARLSAFPTAQPLLEKIPVAPSRSKRGLPSRDSAICRGAPRPFHKMAPRPSTPTVFRECKLHSLNVVPIPDRLEDPIAEPKEENVLHRLFAEIVIDPKYLILGKDCVYIVIQSLGRHEIRSERLLDHDPDPVVRPLLRTAPCHGHRVSR